MRVIAVVAARNEAGRVGDTVRAVRDLDGVDEVVVADGGSEDRTPGEARAAGARVLIGPRRGGKGMSLESALALIAPADIYLFVDADLGVTATEGGRLLEAVTSGRADLAIGALPRQEEHGGFRLVKRTAAALIRALSGFAAMEPLSGQRALTAEALAAVRPLAPGFGVEAAMTIDAVRAGFRVMEIPVAMSHAVTGRNLAGFVHRGRQGWDLLRAGLPRAIRR
ncbi:MAG TPA: glycosyltransferase [Actinomycetota bacterium]|nr:glycosyltransferase [Actinomycetota bacterium]